eukprot:COSAG01_NODE_568_length_15370_cov_26.058018_11_plen_79_part_00
MSSIQDSAQSPYSPRINEESTPSTGETSLYSDAFIGGVCALGSVAKFLPEVLELAIKEFTFKHQITEQALIEILRNGS